MGIAILRKHGLPAKDFFLPTPPNYHNQPKPSRYQQAGQTNAQDNGQILVIVYLTARIAWIILQQSRVDGGGGDWARG
jgi:hypothetical protein